MTIFITVVTDFHSIANTWADDNKVVGISLSKEEAFQKGIPNDFFQIEEWEIEADEATRIFRYQNEHTIGAEGWWEHVEETFKDIMRKETRSIRKDMP